MQCAALHVWRQLSRKIDLAADAANRERGSYQLSAEQCLPKAERLR